MHMQAIMDVEHKFACALPWGRAAETVCHNRKNMTTHNDHMQDNEFIIKLDCQRSGTISGKGEIAK
jgi:hypothetical protein